MRWGIFLLAFFFAGSAIAQSIVVRSGEHSDFTRLVVYLESDDEWDLSEDLGLITLSVSNSDRGFDISQVFRRIGNQRLRSVTASDQALTLSLGCQCRIVVNELSGGSISIDIRESDIRRPLARPIEIDDIKDPEVVKPTEYSDATREASDWPVVFNTSVDTQDLDRIIKKIEDIDSAKFETDLSSEIARGESLSLLEPKSHPLIISPERVKEIRREELFGKLAQRARFSNASTLENTVDEEKESLCPQPEEFAVSKWGGEAPFQEQLANLRGALYLEFDEIDRRAIRSLIQFYVHYGLTQEAQRAISQTSGQDDYSLLGLLAEVVGADGVFDTELRSLASCGGEVGFWGTVGGVEIGEISQDTVTDVVGVFQRLPLHLKELTASRLIEVLESRNFLTAAEVVRASVRRGDLQDTIGIEPKVHRFDLENQTQDQLKDKIAVNDESAPEAVAIFLENALSEKTQISSEMIETAGAFVFQLNGTEIARRLRSAMVLALAERGEFDKAMALFFENTDESLLKSIEVKTKLAQTMQSKAIPFEVSAFVWKLNKRGSLKDLPESELLSLAEFFHANGQPQLAQLPLSKLPPSDELVTVQAQIFAQENRESEAVDLLLGNSDQIIDPRLSSLFLRNNPNAAWAQRDRLRGPAFDNAAWMSGNWRDVAEGNIRDEVSQILASSQTELGDTDKPIKSAVTAVSDSQTAREVLQDLLK